MPKTAFNFLLSVINWGVAPNLSSANNKALNSINSIKKINDKELIIILENQIKIKAVLNGNHFNMKGNINYSNVEKKVATTEDLIFFLRNFY